MRANKNTLFSLFCGFLIGLRLLIDLSLLIIVLKSVLLIVLLHIFAKNKCLYSFLIAFILGLGIYYLGTIDFSSQNNSSFEGIVISAKTNYVILQSKFSRYYLYLEDNTYQFGDYISVKGYLNQLNFTTYESRFDFNEYLRLKGVKYKLTASSITDKYLFPIRLRVLENNYFLKLSDETSSLVDSLLFNHKNYESSVIADASSVGLLNVCSTSGIIFGALLRFLNSIFELKLSKKKSLFLSTLCGVLIFPLAIGKIGIYKVLILRILQCLNIKKKRFAYLDLLSITGLVLLIIDFHNAYQDGFLLSFGVSFILLISSPIIKRSSQFIRTLLRYGIIQLFMLPISIKYSNGFHLLTPLYSYIILPLVEIFSLISLLSFLVIPIPKLLNLFGLIMSKIIFIFSETDLFIPISTTKYFPYFYYFVFFICLFVHEVGDLKVRNIIIYVSLSVYCVSLLPITPLLTNEVSFINVGQGDCCLIRNGLNTIMIDTGGNTSFDMAEESIIPFLRKNRIYKIDYLIGTHGDYDHVGAVESLRKNYIVKNYINNPSTFPISIGDIYLENYNTYSYDDENSSSLVIGCNFIGYKWLFMGDAPEDVELQIINDNPGLDCDIIKIGHHGSDTSSSLKFLKAVTPSTAIISVGATNRYKHPSKTIIKRLESLNIKIRRTDEEGTIRYIKPFYL